MKNFIMRKMMERQLKNVPKEDQEKFMKLVTENPELFEKIAKEIKEEMDGGKEQMQAVMEVATRHKDELKGLM